MHLSIKNTDAIVSKFFVNFVFIIVMTNSKNRIKIISLQWGFMVGHNMLK